MKKETRLAMMRSNPILPCLSTFLHSSTSSVLLFQELKAEGAKEQGRKQVQTIIFVYIEKDNRVKTRERDVSKHPTNKWKNEKD